MIRVLTGISLFWFLIPGYTTALILTFFVPDIYTAIAFDSGGVASGPMTATFMLQFFMGASIALGGNVLQDAFGVVALVAMMPLVSIQLVGLFYERKQKRTKETTVVYGDTPIPVSIAFWARLGLPAPTFCATNEAIDCINALGISMAKLTILQATP